MKEDKLTEQRNYQKGHFKISLQYHNQYYCFLYTQWILGISLTSCTLKKEEEEEEKEEDVEEEEEVGEEEYIYKVLQ